MTFDLSALLRPELGELQPYVPHTGRFALRLDANEAPPLLDEQAQQRLAEVAARTDWARYPDASQQALREALGRRSGVGPEQILAGVGSDEIIALLLTALAQPRPGAERATVLTTGPSFVMYRLSAVARGQDVIEVPLDEAWDVDVKATLAAVERSQPNVVFLASPNNPTGTMVHPERLRRLIEAAPQSLVIVDEAYVDYADRHQLDLVARYANVAVLRTLSKIGFAALRVGWLVGRPELVAELDKVRLPYNLPSPCQALATVALTELGADIERTCATVVAERERVARALSRFAGVQVTPSQANFLWFRTEAPAEAVFRSLCEQGVLVRSFHGKGGRLAHCLRVTIGRAEDNDRFVEAFGRALGG